MLTITSVVNTCHHSTLLQCYWLSSLYSTFHLCDMYFIIKVNRVFLYMKIEKLKFCFLPIWDLEAVRPYKLFCLAHTPADFSPSSSLSNNTLLNLVFVIQNSILIWIFFLLLLQSNSRFILSAMINKSPNLMAYHK